MTNIINYIQFRASRNALNLTLRDLSKTLKINKTTINNAEHGKTRDFFHKNSGALITFFEKRQVIFPSQYMIRLENTKFQQTHPPGFLTRFQLKAARHVIDITQSKLAKLINVNSSLLSAIEKLENSEYVYLFNHQVMSRIKDVYLEYGVEFPKFDSVFFKKYIDNHSED